MGTTAEDRAFWESRNFAGYVDWSQAKPARFPNLKPPTRTVLPRLPVALLERIKVEVGKRDMPYHSLVKIWLADDVDRHRS